MKIRHSKLFATLFASGSWSAAKEKTTRVTVNAYSQPHVLQQRMKEEQLTHGETVMANISR